MYNKLIIALLLLFPTTTTFGQDSKGKLVLPIITFSQGVLNFNGDIGYDRLNQPIHAHSGFEIGIQNHTEGRLSFGLFLLSGRMTGEESKINRNQNFKTSIFSESLRVKYEWVSNKRSDQVLFPYVTIGLELMTFHSKVDLKDANGNPYFYWTDGTVRNVAQTEFNTTAPQTHRDYNYETDIRDANLDGFGKYSENTFFLLLASFNPIRSPLSYATMNASFTFSLVRLLN